ncbi:hypothetical protein DY000_02006677 [Brassica cretica]|uniref:Retrotransposon gag domain-containing protein n=1 Tax=Brassica cretica TaxID=69181 RepID=A0ABQ7BXK4_BRACR|nr:hypothetical protein DY000_02006677 [Brassica cretica]
MEDMDFGRTSIDETTAISVDISTAISSDKSAIRLPKDDTKKFGISPGYVIMEIRSDFINQFYWDVRKKISTFRQGPRESFRNTWERFKSYQLECPHHGYSEPQLINTIYGSINLHYQITLDTSSEGNFSTRNPEEAKRLIKNIAIARSYEMMDVELGRKADPVDESPLLEIEEHLNSPHPALEGHNQFGIYQIDDDTLSELEQQIDFVDSQTLKNNYPNPDSFTQNYDATIGSRQGRAKSRLNQAFTGNRKLATDLNGKIDLIFSELTRKFDALSEHIKRLDSRVAENATAIKRDTGRLPGWTDANPKRQVNAVLLRSRKCLIPRAIEINNTEKHAVVEETGESRSRPIILDDPSTESEVPREKERPNTEEGHLPRRRGRRNERGCPNRSTRKNKRRSTNHCEYRSTLWKQCRSTPDSS